jgi:nucleoside-diphosphate-sugar epimerase
MATGSTRQRVLVSGSTGFLGRHLLDELAERGYEAVCLVRPETDTRILDGRPVIRAAADYSDPAALHRAIAGVRYVFHLGAVLCGNHEQAFFRGNVEATQQLAGACLKVAPPPRFIFASSIAAAGPSRNGVGKSETDPCEPVSAYGRSKLLAERALVALRPGLSLVIVRLPNLLGLGQQQLRTTMSLVRSRIVPIPGGRHRKTSICFAQDAARALLLVAESSPGLGEVYYATDGRSYSWRDLVEPLARVLAPGPVLRVRTPMLVAIAALIQTWARIRRATPSVTVGDILSASRHDWLFDDTRIRRGLGFTPRVDFATEMARLAHAYREGRF